MSHVSALGKHIIQIAKSVLTRLRLVLDVRMHLLALTVDISDDLPLIGNPSLLLLDQAICDAFDLGSDRVQCIVMVLNSILLFLNDGRFKLIPIDIYQPFQYFRIYFLARSAGGITLLTLT